MSKTMRTSSMSSTDSSRDSYVPYKQIRAVYDTETITVYQAYSAAIAIPAVKEQKLSASPEFRYGRMTWIKPSWCWMMYRAGYSFKDENQAHILAIKIKHDNFQNLLYSAVVTSGHALSEDQKSKPVRVQWDPERDPHLAVLPYRSIQIGIGRGLSEQWVQEWIVNIEDVTDKARALKQAVDGDPSANLEDLVCSTLMPQERPYVVPEDLRKHLAMD